MEVDVVFPLLDEPLLHQRMNMADGKPLRLCHNRSIEYAASHWKMTYLRAYLLVV